MIALLTVWPDEMMVVVICRSYSPPLRVRSITA
jgi:hypothetical protein